MISEKLKRSREYEDEHIKKVPEEERPLYHVTGGVGWINDPNGFGMYKGEYHLFFQYHPYSTHWGPMHWGHVKTKDFIKWERLPIAIAPDTDVDEAGCFSGSSIELPDGRQLLMYTGVHRKENAQGDMEDFQQQCIAIGDGIDYEKYTANPVITTDMIPEGNNLNDFRDPKIWKENGIYKAVVGSRGADTSGEILLYESENCLDWKFVRIIDKCNDEYGKMWECPDYFLLDGKQILAVSPQEMQASGLEFHAGNGTVFSIGEERADGSFMREGVQAIDYGLDFYAPQTLLTEDGRRIMIAWMQNWETSNCGNAARQIFGEMTIPRELSFRNGRVCQNPVAEISNYYSRKTSYKNVLVQDEVSLPGISGRVIDMTLTVRPVDKGVNWFKISVAKDGDKETTICYDAARKVIRIDRTKSGLRNDIVSVREFYVDPTREDIKMRILMDRHSVELFVNDGEQAASTIIYTPQTAEAITFDTDGTAVMDVENCVLEF